MAECWKCANEPECPWACPKDIICSSFKPYKSKPITNADRIRAMTDEELAEFIAYKTSCETCVVRKGGSDECHNTNCSTAWLDWLKEEAIE